MKGSSQRARQRCVALLRDDISDTHGPPVRRAQLLALDDVIWHSLAAERQ